jgi:hypothetical protein
MKTLKRIGLTLVYTLIVLIVGAVISTAVTLITAFPVGYFLLAVLVLAMLVSLCWIVAGETVNG